MADISRQAASSAGIGDATVTDTRTTEVTGSAGSGAMGGTKARPVAKQANDALPTTASGSLNRNRGTCRR